MLSPNSAMIAQSMNSVCSRPSMETTDGRNFLLACLLASPFVLAILMAVVVVHFVVKYW
jgi:hypothetical protein